jgi:hypothetical protein
MGSFREAGTDSVGNLRWDTRTGRCRGALASPTRTNNVANFFMRFLLLMAFGAG